MLIALVYLQQIIEDKFMSVQTYVTIKTLFKKLFGIIV